MAQIQALIAEFDAKIAANRRDLKRAFGRARWLMAHQRWTEAMDELLEILMRDKGWNDEAARKTYVSILKSSSRPSLKVAEGRSRPKTQVVASYRRRLSSVVLS